MNPSEMWQAVLDRDGARDGTFVYAVRSTGIYCRPSCPSRRPNRGSVDFYASPREAEAQGFRACRRCRPDCDRADDPHVERMQQVCRYLERQDDRIPTLDELAAEFGLSPFYLQRTFKRVVGVSPGQYARASRAERFKTALRDEADVTGAVYSAGYGSGSVAYADAPSLLGMTPANYRWGGERMTISYAVAPCSLGWLLVAATERGLCAVRLGDDREALVETLTNEFPAATVAGADPGLERALEQLTEHLAGSRPHLDLPVDVQATAFQRQVWQALCAIPYGQTRSYREVAQAIGRPEAVRAVAGACAGNPVALVVPCHRVRRSDGSLGGYRWGVARKEALLRQEALHTGQTVDAREANA